MHTRILEQRLYFFLRFYREQEKAESIGWDNAIKYFIMLQIKINEQNMKPKQSKEAINQALTKNFGKNE